MRIFLFLIIVLFSCLNAAFSQQEKSTCFLCNAELPDKKRIRAVIGTEIILSTSSLIGLNHLWYKNYPRSSFHFFNDNEEWLQVDKVGHIITAYYTGLIGVELLKWGGLSNKQSALYGSMLGFVYQTGIEILDGFSSEWGFSMGDFAANALGTAALVSQQLVWEEQRIVLKYSFHTTHFSSYRPELLGKTLAEKILKDYNGQTYWLSANIASFINNENSKFPKWLNLALGYGATGMIGARQNPTTDNNGNVYPTYDRVRQYYFSLDADLSKIKTDIRWFKAITKTFGFIKIPAPTIEFSKNKMKFYPVYF